MLGVGRWTQLRPLHWKRLLGASGWLKKTPRKRPTRWIGLELSWEVLFDLKEWDKIRQSVNVALWRKALPKMCSRLDFQVDWRESKHSLPYENRVLIRSPEVLATKPLLEIGETWIEISINTQHKYISTLSIYLSVILDHLKKHTKMFETLMKFSKLSQFFWIICIIFNNKFFPRTFESFLIHKQRN